MILPSIYSFTNYREYLNKFYTSHKEADPGYSFQRFSTKGEIGSPNLLKLVMDGDKNLSTTSLLKFAKALGLDDAETEYFETMVLENQAEEPFEKKYYARKLKALSMGKSAKTVRIGARTTLFDHPLMPSLIVYLAGAQKEQALAQISKVIPLPFDEIIKIIQLLKREEILKDENGHYQVDFDHAIFHRKSSDLVLRNYLEKQVQLSKKAFEKSYEKNGKFLSHSMGISVERYHEIIGSLKNAISEVNSKYNSEPAEEVIQINIQAFLLSDLMS